MLTCKQVSKALSENRYYELPLKKKFGLSLHIILCPFCGKANNQIVMLQKGIRKFLEREEKEHFAEVYLNPDERERIRQRISEKM
ncbi:MAG: hypothetical protein ACJZ85_02030 [Pontiellaceae bacterium]